MFRKLQQYSLYLFLLFPWTTVWIYREVLLDGGKWEYGTLSFYASELILWMSVGFFVLVAIGKLKKRSHFSFTTDRKAMVAGSIMLVPFFLSIIWAYDAAIAWQHALRMMLMGILFILLLLEQQRSRIYWLLTLGGLLPAMLGIYQFIAQASVSSTMLGLTAHMPSVSGTSVIVVEGERWLRAYGHAPHPNMVGGFMLMSLIAGWLLLQRTQQHRALIQVLMCIEAMALFFSFSRSAWIAALLFVGVSSWYKKGSWKSLRLVMVSIAILASIFSHLIIGRVAIQSVNEKQSVTERVSAVQEFFTVFASAPLGGVGAGNYTAAVMDLFPEQPVWEYQPVHIVPLLMLAEVGVVGMTMVFMGLGYIGFLYRKYWRDIVVILLPLAPLCLFDHYLYSSYMGLMILGVCFSYIPAIHSLSTTEQQAS